MSSTTRTTYPSFTEARKSLKDILDAVEDGAMVTIERGGRAAVVTDRNRMRELLLTAVPPTARVVAEHGAWVIVIPDTPLAAEGESLDAAIDDLVANLREYASEWGEHFAAAPNHAGNWALVQLVNLSTDEGLRDWLTSAQA
jgi:PHD/YefM family antitoxin component YafN of YafNO toxin-antitoxin module